MESLVVSFVPNDAMSLAFFLRLYIFQCLFISALSLYFDACFETGPPSGSRPLPGDCMAAKANLPYPSDILVYLYRYKAPEALGLPTYTGSVELPLQREHG